MVKSSEFVPSEAGTRSRIISGLTAQMVTFVALFIESIVLVPLFIDAWGPSTYQGWVVLYSAGQFLILADFGTAYYFDNSIRMAWAAGRQVEYRRNVALGFGCYFVLFAVSCVCLLLFALSPGFRELLENSGIEPAIADFVFISLAAAVLIELLRVPLTSIYNARGDFARRECFFSIQTVIKTCVIALLLVMGCPPTTIALTVLIVTILIGLVGPAIDQKFLYPGSKYSVGLPTKAEFRKICRVSGLYFIPRSLDPVVTHIPIILLSIAGPGGLAVVTFTVARTFTGLIRMFAVAFSWVVGIELSRQLSQNDREAQARLFDNSYRFISTSVGLLSGFAVVAAEPAIRLWTRDQVPYDAWVVYALILRMIVCSASQAASAYFKSTNEAGPLAAANALHIALVLSLCILLSPSLGALGTALALLVSETLSNACLLLIFASKHLGVRPLRLVVKHQGLGLLSFALSAVCAMMTYRTVGRDSLVNLAFGGAVWTLMVSVPALFLVFNASQRRWIWGSVKALAGRLALSG